METIYLPDNTHPVIKLERLADSDTELEDSKPAIQRTKMGEIYQTTRDHLSFVCTHCSAEFSLFIQFTSHIEQHLQTVFSAKVEPATDTKIAYPIGDSSEIAMIWKKTETKIEDSTTTAHWAETVSNYSDSADENEPNESIAEVIQLETIDQERQVDKRESNFECAQCGRQFKNSIGLKSHQSRIHSNQKFQCTSCSKSYTAVETFTRHVKDCQINHVGLSRSKPDISDDNAGANLVTPQVKDNNSEQLGNITAAKTFECFQCHEQLSAQIECKVHIHNHLNVETTCEHCARTIQTKTSSRLHRRYCKLPTAQDVPTDCPVCNQTFLSYGQYFVHAREDHRLTLGQIKQKQKTKCGRCSVEFDTRLDYEKHLESHKSLRHIKEHTCKLCGKVYRKYFMYRQHLQRHEGKGQFKCEICENTYANSYRKEHMRTHTGERKFQCSECGALWASMAILRNHMMTHTNERPHQCEYCQKRFRKTFLLQAHKRVHTGDYVHYCKACKKGYTHKTGLKKHNLKIHGLVDNRDKNITKRREIL